MLRQLLEEAFEEFKQTVAPARPEIAFPLPPQAVTTLPQPRMADEMMPRSQAPAPSSRRPSAPLRVERPGAAANLRSQLTSPASVRSAFRIMEVLGPPVALRDPLDRVHDR